MIFVYPRKSWDFVGATKTEEKLKIILGTHAVNLDSLTLLHI